ncbi:MAG: hypothetical protein M4579_005184 [Chaenotheca gracillima]|nr:MAG: hypothetical protein M4579_005184 [Chaenotheca gracillima]
MSALEPLGSSETELPTYTPTTKRISKAKKGKRVHRCNQCENKVFTRAEHLRRHQWNHKSEGRFKCEMPNCERTFYRQDLLTRHIDRHSSSQNKQVIENDHRRRSVSQFSLVSSVSGSGNFTSSSGEYVMMGVPQHAPTIQYGLQPSTSAEQLHSSTQGMTNALLSPLSIPGGSGPHGLLPELVSTGSDESPLTSSVSSSYSFSDRFQTPFPMQAYNANSRPRSGSAMSAPEQWYHVTKSPMGAAAGIPTWSMAGSTPPPPQVMTPFDSPLYQQVGYPTHGQVSQERGNIFSTASIDLPNSEIDGSTFYELRSLMVGQIGLSMDHDGSCARVMNKIDEYLELYWQRFHPLFPIVHRASFSSKTESPVLVAIIATIGALYAGTNEANSLAIAVHRRCKDMLVSRSPIHRGSSISDIQSVVLIETFGKFRSGKIDTQLSQQFKNLFISLLQDRHQRARNLETKVKSYQKQSNPAELHSIWCSWLELECKQRALLAAFLLDAHQSTLFGQDPCQQNCLFGQMDLSMPSHSALWDSQGAEEWNLVCQSLVAPSANSVQDEMFRFLADHENTGAILAPFEASIVVALTLTSNGMSTDDQVDELLRHRLEERYPTSHSLLITCNSFQVLHFTPLRDLLAVTGQTWVLGRKMSSHAEFAAAKDRLNAWVLTPAASKAVWHAGHVLRHAFHASSMGFMWNNPGDDLHDQWNVYVAALVCWAYGTAHSNHASPSPSTGGATVLPMIGEERAQAWEYLTALDTVSWEDVIHVQQLWRTTPVLLCVKDLIKGTYGGLLKDAEEVLSHLVQGRLDAMTL